MVGPPMGATPTGWWWMRRKWQRCTGWADVDVVGAVGWSGVVEVKVEVSQDESMKNKLSLACCSFSRVGLVGRECWKGILFYCFVWPCVIHISVFGGIFELGCG